ncbi:hypothetical protein [Chitinophaga pinensis]|uniref:Uncharacterized protein n=1 Tax=Chitinophaga pinensis TaxID=79329 RepID=A0A5C6LY97_9BACT|nr:hypothetical protein [Chitinophaga pinensis]TWW01792.1 hypothetical protein FEF09_04320 [Chitinophaga pinensis]
MNILNALLPTGLSEIIIAFGFMILFFVLGVLLTRRIFRINDIVAHLKSINEKLDANHQSTNRRDL